MSIFDNIENDKIIGEKTIEKAKKIGIEKLLIFVGRDENYELNLHTNTLDLFRTTFTESISITGYIGHKRGSVAINTLNINEIEKNLEELKNIIESSLEDSANELAPFEAIKEFSDDNFEFSKEEMVYRLEELIDNVKGKYPLINLEEGLLDYERGYLHLISSNGTHFLDKSRKYSFTTVFSSRKEDKVSSFNYFTCSKKDLKKPILNWENLEFLLRQNIEQLDAKNINNKFEGSIIFTPSSAWELFSFLLDSLRDSSIIKGTSIYKDMVGQNIASDILTIIADPLSNEFVSKSFFTSDGFLTKPLKLIDNGKLNSLLLSYYGSLKTGRPRAPNYGQGFIIKGNDNLQDLIKSTSNGILMDRFSGGEVTPNGDFSGIAKNSYIIKNGQILYPVTETMVSGNYSSLFKSINGISKEHINDGFSFIPYIKSEGVIISGK